jgi:hypothetical protein
VLLKALFISITGVPAPWTSTDTVAGTLLLSHLWLALAARRVLLLSVGERGALW